MDRKLTLKSLTLSTSKAIYTLNKLFMQILGPSYPCFTWQCSRQIFARRYRKTSQRKSWRSLFFSRIEAAQLWKWRIIWIIINLHRDNMTWSKWIFVKRLKVVKLNYQPGEYLLDDFDFLGKELKSGSLGRHQDYPETCCGVLKEACFLKNCLDLYRTCQRIYGKRIGVLQPIPKCSSIQSCGQLALLS